MFIIKLHGGLGNQLFQYALSLYFKKNNPDCIIVYDISFFNLPDQKFPRDFSLKRFLVEELNTNDFGNVTPNFAAKLYKRIKRNCVYRLLNRKAKKFIYSIYVYFSNIIKEDTRLGYNFFLKYKCYKQFSLVTIDGYWSDIRYFAEILDYMRVSVIKLNQSENLGSFINQINPKDVALHVRRGDFLSIGQNSQGMFLGIEYYAKALESLLLEGKIDDTTSVYIFTDDYDWCKAHLVSKFPSIRLDFRAQLLSDEESFEVMRHFPILIIANSTYSLWAAYLNKYPECPTILFPKKWSDQLVSSGYRIVPDSKNWKAVDFGYEGF